MHLSSLVRRFGRNVPNILSASRLIFAPLIPIAFSKGLAGIAFWLLLLAFASDVFDGAIAVKYHLESRLGRFLDFFADSVFFGSCLTTLYIADRFTVTLAIVVVVIAILAQTIRLRLEKQSIFRRLLCLLTPIGFFLTGFLTGVLLVYRSVGDSTILIALAWAWAALTIVSFLYFKRKRLLFWLRGGVSILGR